MLENALLEYLSQFIRFSVLDARMFTRQIIKRLRKFDFPFYIENPQVTTKGNQSASA